MVDLLCAFAFDAGSCVGGNKGSFQTDATENTVSTEIPKLTKDNYRDYPGLVESV